MSTFHFSRTDVFGPGSSVSVYPATNWPQGDIDFNAAPVGPATDTQTMGSTGCTFTGLTDNAIYVAYALVDFRHRYVRLSPATDTSDAALLQEIADNTDTLEVTADSINLNTDTLEAIGAATRDRLPAALDADGGLKVHMQNSVSATVSGEVEVKNDSGSPLPVSGTVGVSNFPATQPVSGTVSVSQPVAVTDNAGSLTVDGSVAVSNLPATQPVSGTVAVSNLPATQPVSAAALPLPAGAATSANQTTELGHLSRMAGALVPAAFDFVDLNYTGTDLTTVIFKSGGSTVKTLTLTYASGLLDTVTAA